METSNSTNDIKTSRLNRCVEWPVAQIFKMARLGPSFFSCLKLVPKVILHMKCWGFRSVEYQIRMLQSYEYARQLVVTRGLPAQFVPFLVFGAKTFIRCKTWWFSSEIRKKATITMIRFVQGEIFSLANHSNCNIEIFIDAPRSIFLFSRGDIDIKGWAVNRQNHQAPNVRIKIGGRTCYPFKTLSNPASPFIPAKIIPLYKTIFSASARPSPGFYKILIEAEEMAGEWVPIHRTFVFQSPVFRRKCEEERAHEISYQAWVKLEHDELQGEMADISRHIEVMAKRPGFSIVIDLRSSLFGYDEMMRSIANQIYPPEEILFLSLSGGLPGLLLPKGAKVVDCLTPSAVEGDFIIFLREGQILSENALYEFAAMLNARPDTDLVYGDQDNIDAHRRRTRPFHKPDWSPDYLETFNYIGFTAGFKTAEAKDFFDFDNLYDLMLRFTEGPRKIVHIEKILGHHLINCKDDLVEEAQSTAADIKALEGRLVRTGRRGTVMENPRHRGCYDIQLELKRAPLVSVILPTAGNVIDVGGRRLDLICNVIENIRNKSTYKNIEIIVVDNGDLTDGQIQTLAEHRCKRVTYSETGFNIAKKLNLGATLANGELLLLMNDDIEIITPNWIERMVEHFEKPHVGIVGTKLLYPDGRTQHVGVAHILGNPMHVRRFYPKNDSGYFFSTCGVRNFSAVTGACMMTRTGIYQETGGYCEDLAVSFNDIDFCMQVRQLGFSVVYAPGSELIHMESVSRSASADEREVALFHQKWAKETTRDPFYNNRHLSVGPPTFTPCFNERTI